MYFTDRDDGDPLPLSTGKTDSSERAVMAVSPNAGARPVAASYGQLGASMR